MPLGELHHVELYVSDLGRSLDFWSWLLGMLGYSKYQEWEEGTSFILGSTYIVLVQTEEAHLGVPYHRKRTGLNHLAFHADTTAQVDEITDALKEKGVPILYLDRHPHASGPDSYSVFFEDPDRIKLEITASV